MGNTCSATPTSTDAVELIPDVHEPSVLWDFINPRKKTQKYGFLCIHGVSKWRIGFTDGEFNIYDMQQDVSAIATITESTEEGFMLTATFDYIVRQTVYYTPTITKPRTLSFAFSLKDNIEHNVHMYGWRTKVGVYEKCHLLEYCGLV